VSPGLCKLAHIDLVTPDLDASLFFFRDLLGMHEVERADERVFLRCFGELDHHSLSLRPGPAGVDHVAFRTARPEDVAEFAAAFAAEGIEVSEVGAGEEPGQGEAIRFLAPGLEAPLELLFEIERPRAPESLRSKLPSNSARFAGAAARRLDHVNFATGIDRLAEAEDWLREALGFRRREFIRLPDGRIGGTWLSVTPQVHDVAITTDVQGRTGRFNHFAFNVEEFADICRLADVLAEHDVHVDVPPSRHGITQGHCYYVRDPGSGHRVELFSGGYLIFDPDWEPIEWTLEQLDTHGLVFVGPAEWTRQNNPNAENTPATAAVAR
jgi:catechol 2,3-dioxygenase